MDRKRSASQKPSGKPKESSRSNDKPSGRKSIEAGGVRTRNQRRLEAEMASNRRVTRSQVIDHVSCGDDRDPDYGENQFFAVPIVTPERMKEDMLAAGAAFERAQNDEKKRKEDEKMAKKARFENPDEKAPTFKMQLRGQTKDISKEERTRDGVKTRSQSVVLTKQSNERAPERCVKQASFQVKPHVVVNKKEVKQKQGEGSSKFGVRTRAMSCATVVAKKTAEEAPVETGVRTRSQRNAAAVQKVARPRRCKSVLHQQADKRN